MDQAQQLRNIIKKNNIKQKSTARVITVTSGKGGVGKSNVAINLGIQLRKMGNNVIILDADFGLANIEVMFGTIPKYNLRDTVEGKRSLREIITEGPLGVKFISGGTGVEGLANLSKVQLGNLLRGVAELDEIADIIIKEFDLRPSAIIDKFNLQTPVYLKTAAYGHFGNPDFAWEQTDKVEDLKKYL